MLESAVWIVAAVAAVLGLDRLLLRAESRGWIRYRRSGLGRGASIYHLLEIHSIYDPRIKQVIEAKFGEEAEEDETGEPPF